jgi:hypothetical protein
VAACIPCKFAELIFTTRLAELLGPAEQVGLVAVEVRPVRALPAERAVPDD